MSFLSKMYNSTKIQATANNKNPNRVLGGLKGHGADHYSMLGEDGTERQVPTRAYVQGLEEKLRRLEQTVLEQDKKIRRLSNDQKLDRQAFSRTLKP